MSTQANALNFSTANGVVTTGTGGIPVVTSVAANGDLIVGSGSGAPAAATLSGGTGITITNAANSITVGPTALGSFTPGIAFGGSNTGITYTTQTGFYYQIGSIVFVQINIVLSSKGAQTGSATLTGLPVSTGSAGSNNYIFVDNFVNFFLSTP